MVRIQARIGYLFSIFSLLIFTTHVVFHFISKKDIIGFISIENLSYLLYSGIFLASALWKNIFFRVVQVLIVFLESMFALCSSPSEPFGGLAMIVVAILLSYAYGYFKEHKKLKLFVSSLITYSVFVFIPLENKDKKFMYAFEWVLFITVFLFVCWIIFKDAINTMEEKRILEEKRIFGLAEEASKAARDALEISKEEIQNIKD